jgi:iron complex outermembrane receptor protein
MDLSPNLQLDLLGRYVDGLPGPRVDRYTTVDARLAWHPLPGWEIAVVGQNLLEERHGEFKPIFVSSLPTQVQRSVYGTLTWRY